MKKPVPAYVAFRRRHPNRWLILAVNLAFGTTGFGWIVAMVWACNAVHLAGGPGQSNGGQSGLNLFVNDARVVRQVSQGASTLDGGRDTAWAVRQIERLDALHDRGHLSDDEHRRLKGEVLAAVTGG